MTLDEYIESTKKNIITGWISREMTALREKYGDEYEDAASCVLQLVESLGYDPVSCIREFMMEYMEGLDYFLETGEYGHDDYEAIKKSVYDDEHFMKDIYMPGLLLSYISLGLLYEKYRFFKDKFIPLIKPGAAGIDAGFGEGLYLYLLSRRRPDVRIEGFDISRHSEKFARRLLGEASDIERVVLSYGDMRHGLSVADSSADFFVMSEVIEHLPDPAAAIREMARIMKEGAVFYVSTVIDSNHADHIVNFSDESVLTDMLAKNSLITKERLIYKVQDEHPKSRDPSIGLAYIGEKATL